MKNTTIATAAAAVKNPAPTKKAGGGVTTILNSMLDSDGYRKRFNELLGKRAPQFVSSMITLVNADESLKRAVIEAPQTVVQACLKAATYDLPIDPGLGYAYIVPFNNSIKSNGSYKKRMEASFIMGYKGMNQLALRTGVYKKINVIDVREGELKSYNRLTEDIELDFIEDEDERDALPIIGWCGFYRLVNGTEKIIYMTRKQVEKHEQKHRKGKYVGKGWREDFNAMAEKTVFRRLIGKYGLMSIDYQRQSDPAVLKFAEDMASGTVDDEQALYDEDGDTPIEAEGYVVDEDTGEVKESSETTTAPSNAM